MPSSISVIVVSWNAKAYLLKCLETIYQQKAVTPIEVIVVDNASSDGSPEAVESSFPAAKVIRSSRNLGFAKGNNIGIRESRGDYLFFINSDVEILDQLCFAKILSYLVANPSVGLLGPQILAADRQPQRSCMGYPTLGNSLARALALDTIFPKSRVLGGQLLPYWKYDETQEVDVVNGCFWVTTRVALDRVGPLDERFLIYGEDVDWCKRFHDAEWKVVYYAGANAIHYGGGSSANAPVKFYLELQRANVQYWQKHRSPAAVAGLILILIVHHIIRLGVDGVSYLMRPGLREPARLRITRSLRTLQWLPSVLASTSEGRTLDAGERAL